MSPVQVWDCPPFESPREIGGFLFISVDNRVGDFNIRLCNWGQRAASVQTVVGKIYYYVAQVWDYTGGPWTESGVNRACGVPRRARSGGRRIAQRRDGVADNVFAQFG